jgi:excisionase family DNA binding protein
MPNFDGLAADLTAAWSAPGVTTRARQQLIRARVADIVADIAATLNRMGVRTGQGKTWTAHRVGSIRKVHGMHAYRSAEKDGAWLTMREAAAKLGVTSHVIRRMIVEGVLPAEQVVQGAPWQIPATDLDAELVLATVARKGRPCHALGQATLPMFPDG